MRATVEAAGALVMRTLLQFLCVSDIVAVDGRALTFLVPYN
jgi:hypothetical protein